VTRHVEERPDENLEASGPACGRSGQAGDPPGVTPVTANWLVAWQINWLTGELADRRTTDELTD